MLSPPWINISISLLRQWEMYSSKDSWPRTTDRALATLYISGPSLSLIPISNISGSSCVCFVDILKPFSYLAIALSSVDGRSSFAFSFHPKSCSSSHSSIDSIVSVNHFKMLLLQSRVLHTYLKLAIRSLFF
jgi:hypothetical protein